MDPSINPNRRLSKTLAGPAVLVLLVIGILSQSLFSNGQFIPTAPTTDARLQFLGWRYFGFTQWTQGHFPLWNPHVFCGLPFFAQVQSSLLYPVCWIYFFLRVGVGANIEFAVDLCLAALGAYAWARQRRISRSGATLVGAIFVFSGPVYLRTLAGHLAPLAAISWIPLVFLAIDRLLNRQFLSGIVVGALAVSMQFLGGHPQSAYYTAIAGSLYLLLESIGKPRPIAIYAMFAAMYVLGCTMAAVQILPQLHASALSIRAGGTSYAFSSSYALSPADLPYLFIPFPYGDLKHIPYLGEWYLWETSIYAGLIALFMACIAMAYRSRSSRWRMGIFLLAVMVLMLGPTTPVHKLLYHFLPGFDLFRGASKFGAIWTLLIALLAGEGFDQIRQKPPARPMILITAATAICFFMVGGILTTDASQRYAAHLLPSAGQQLLLTNKLMDHPELLTTLLSWVRTQAFIAGGLLLAASLLLAARRKSVNGAYRLLGLAIIETYAAALLCTMHSPATVPMNQAWQQPIAEAQSAHQRVLFTDDGNGYANSGNAYDFDSAWGYDPGQPRRYTRLIQISQGIRSVPEVEYSLISFQRMSPIFPLLRIRYVLQATPKQKIMQVDNPFPHLLLLGKYIKMTDSDAMAERLSDPHFNARQVAILQTNPAPAPTPAGAKGTARVLRESINDLEIEADLPSPALLLVTDAYDPGWQIHPMDSMPNYQVLQADDVLRAIPLSAGHHHFDLYYTAPGLHAGITISTIAWAIWLAGLIAMAQSPRNLFRGFHKACTTR